MPSESVFWCARPASQDRARQLPCAGGSSAHACCTVCRVSVVPTFSNLSNSRVKIATLCAHCKQGACHHYLVRERCRWRTQHACCRDHADGDNERKHHQYGAACERAQRVRALQLRPAHLRQRGRHALFCSRCWGPTTASN
eukprot:553141-Rhodomonas_salina.1